MGAIAYVMVIIGYALLYTGLMDFSGHKTGLIAVLGHTGSSGLSIDDAQFTYSNPVANMTSQPALYTLNNGITGSVSV
jgi:hypothetical protein